MINMVTWLFLPFAVNVTLNLPIALGREHWNQRIRNDRTNRQIYSECLCIDVLQSLFVVVVVVVVVLQDVPRTFGHDCPTEKFLGVDHLHEKFF